jgi:hypothetical protein
MKKQDLKLGEIYVSKDDYIFKLIDFNYGAHNISLVPEREKFYPNNGGTLGLGLAEPFKEATKEEKHWLNKCIEAKQFIPKEVAMKDFFILPEKWYVEGIYTIMDTVRKESLECKFINSLQKGNNYGFFKKNYYFIDNNRVNYTEFTPPINRTLITIEQFRKYVINGNNKSNVIIKEKSNTFTIEQIEQILKDNYDGDDLNDLVNIFKKQLV